MPAFVVQFLFFFFKVQYISCCLQVLFIIVLPKDVIRILSGYVLETTVVKMIMHRAETTKCLASFCLIHQNSGFLQV